MELVLFGKFPQQGEDGGGAALGDSVVEQDQGLDTPVGRAGPDLGPTPALVWSLRCRLHCGGQKQESDRNEEEKEDEGATVAPPRASHQTERLALGSKAAEWESMRLCGVQ